MMFLGLPMGTQACIFNLISVYTTHVDDLTLLANAPDALQTILNRFVVYIDNHVCTLQKIHHQHCKFRGGPFRGAQVPIFTLAG